MTRVWLVLAIVVTVVLATCDDSSDAAPRPFATGSTTTPATTTPATATTQLDDRPCDRTLLPVADDVDLITEGAENLTYPRVEPFDSNGNAMSLAGPSFVVTRADGAVTFTSPGGIVTSSLPLGDLDGDGRSDYLLFAFGGAKPFAAFLISGTVPPGTHNVRDVGRRLSLLEAEKKSVTDFHPVGDQNADGGDDLAISNFPDGDTNVYSGRALLAGRSGSRVRLPPPLASLDKFIGSVQVDDPGPPSIVQMHGVFTFNVDRNDRIELKVFGATVDCLVTTLDPVDDFPRPSWGFLRLTGWLVGSHRVIVLSIDVRNTPIPPYRWDLDADE